MPKTKLMKQDQSGQTLVEVIIAIAVLALAMGSAGSLAATSTKLSTESGRRTQATALASRELEALRSLRNGLAENTAVPRTLHQYFPGNADVLTADCYTFVLKEDSTNSIGWRTEAANTPEPYVDSDFGSSTSVAGVDNYRRLVTACQGDDYEASGPSTVSEHIYDIQVRVVWNESGGPERELTYRSMLSTPRGAHYE